WNDLIARRDDLSSDDVARALYWRGKAQSRLGRSDDAHDSFAQAAAITPASYYSLRAASVLGQIGSSAAGGSNDVELAEWLPARGQDLNAARAVITADPAL